ncbi:MAG: DUF349 domain-containing protein [Frankiaceae bacterium]
MSEQLTSEWGRIAPDGTVYVRTADGERVIGSWYAGTPEEGIAYFALRYADLATEVAILAKRLATDAAHAKAVSEAAARIRASLPEARVIGDLDELDRQLGVVAEQAQDRLAEHRAARASERAAATAAKQALVEEAERISVGNDWKTAGDRLRGIVDEWRAIKGAEKAAETDLWRRFAAARDGFTRRRSEHFAALDKQRKASVARKKELIDVAESLSDSEDWAATATRYRELLTEWKAAGRGAKDADDALWARFRAAQDAFFTRRSAMHAEKDAGLRRNREAKEALLAEAEALVPATDLPGAQRTMRDLLERWTAAGRAPREAEPALERRLEAVQDRVRDAADARWESGRSVDASPLVIRLRESIAKLEGRVARARERGDMPAAAEAEAALETQRGWLAQAQRS